MEVRLTPAVLSEYFWVAETILDSYPDGEGVADATYAWAQAVYETGGSRGKAVTLEMDHEAAEALTQEMEEDVGPGGALSSRVGGFFGSNDPSDRALLGAVRKNAQELRTALDNEASSQ